MISYSIPPSEKYQRRRPGRIVQLREEATVVVPDLLQMSGPLGIRQGIDPEMAILMGITRGLSCWNSGTLS